MNAIPKLTGRTRYRTHKPLFGKELVVLQVEVRASWRIWPSATEVSETFWRDANVVDITVDKVAA